MQQSRRFACVIAVLSLMNGMAVQASGDAPSPVSTVLFVCEHGSVKSVMAATILDYLAQRRGMAVRGIARGVQPDENVPPRIVAALRLEGADVASFRPRRADQLEIQAATRVIAIGAQPQAVPTYGRSVEIWDDIPESRDYSAARAALVRHVEALLDEFEAAAIRNKYSR